MSDETDTAYKAGAMSRNAEINELRRELEETQVNLASARGMLDAESDNYHSLEVRLQECRDRAEKHMKMYLETLNRAQKLESDLEQIRLRLSAAQDAGRR